MVDETQTTSREAQELLKANTTLVIWLIFLVIGGGLLALYYARIGYLPDIEWKSSIVYLAVASVIGGGVGLLLALSLLLPGLIWAEFLVFDDKLDGVFCFDTERGKEPCMRTILRYVGIPFAVVLLLSHISLVLGVVFFRVTVDELIYGIIASVLLAMTFVFMRSSFTCLLSADSSECKRSLSKLYRCILKILLSKDSRVREGLDPELKRRIFKYSFWFTLSVLLSQISMLVLYRISGKPRGVSFIVLTVICIAGVSISNHVVAVRYVHHPRQAIAASLVSAVLLLFAADRFSPLSPGIMAYYGFGEGQIVNLVVNDEGAAIIERLSLSNKCPQTTRGRICDVEILSKLGSEYYLRLGGRTFTLPKTTVLSQDSNDRQPK